MIFKLFEKSEYTIRINYVINLINKKINNIIVIFYLYSISNGISDKNRYFKFKYYIFFNINLYW